MTKKYSNSPFFCVLLVLALGYSIYYHFSNNQEVNLDEYIKKNQVTFLNLPLNIQESYIPKTQLQTFQEKLRSNDKKMITTLEKEKNTLKAQLTTALKEKDAILNKAKSTSKRYNAIGCYDESAGTKFINKSCRDKISRFLVRNQKKAIKFEIIAVLDTQDKAFIKNKIAQVDTTKAIKNSLREFLTQGLARTRVLEAAYLVKDTLGNKALITYVNYIAQTTDKRGITIRAYY
jgi:flagellar basal body-associated protein FliL